MAKFSTSSKSDVLVHIGIIIAGFLVLFFSFFFIYLPWSTNHGQVITVPDLRGMTLDEMEDALDSKDLNYEVTDCTFVASAKPLSVFAQFPKAGSTVKEGRKIYLTIITEKPPLTAVPDVINRSINSAKGQLLSKQLEAAEPEYVPDIAENTVLRIKLNGKEIHPGEMIPKGSKVTLVVGDGLGNQMVEVPSLEGMPVDEAEILLAGQNLTLGTVIYDPNSTEAPGTVIKQRPASGSNKIRIGDVIDIWVAGSSGETPTEPIPEQQ